MQTRALPGLFLVTFASLALSEGLARADAAPPETYTCAQPNGTQMDRPKAGEPCATSPNTGAPVDGKCTASKCTALDYANWDRDASATPPSKEYDCNKCVSTSSSSSGGVADSGTSVGTDAGKPTTTTAPAADDGGCNVSERRTLGSVAPWLLALAVPAFLFITKRRRRQP